MEAEGQAQLAGHGVHTHGCEGEADGHRGEDLEGRTLAHAHEGTEGQQVDREELGRAELQGELGDQGGHEGDHHHRQEGADEGGGEGAGQCFASMAFLGHGIAVEGGGDRPGFTRDVEQDRRDGAAEEGPPVDAGQHDDGRGRVHAEGQRQQDGHAVGAAQTRQHADEHPEDDADHHEQEVHGRHHCREALEQCVDFFHFL